MRLRVGSALFALGLGAAFGVSPTLKLRRFDGELMLAERSRAINPENAHVDVVSSRVSFKVTSFVVNALELDASKCNSACKTGYI
jgi:hypothetical protein